MEVDAGRAGLGRGPDIVEKKECRGPLRFRGVSVCGPRGRGGGRRVRAWPPAARRRGGGVGRCRGTPARGPRAATVRAALARRSGFRVECVNSPPWLLR
ncbi:hypothetical protein PSMK_16920 [Phycisphaera mikurensis NBRC 102666]|uniref:Uncharacterized protein n=1 Tax=Phycisphaera mikurensis (strain NBRC 102666 / KCTC 22515 / FYK2301M01) TaxID=1142394 RepID=I0IF13_PHYMF|nr:hypothetical protein PSMK_16920 [Phycisphaera mikurensis NBRC 102666]